MLDLKRVKESLLVMSLTLSKDEKELIYSMYEELHEWHESVTFMLDDIGPEYAVRVCEGGGQEDLIMSLVVTVSKLNKAAPKPTRWYGECPICPGAFQYEISDVGKENPHPNGLMCPECRKAGYSPVGVVNFELRE